MATVLNESSRVRHWCARVGTTDFCPWANRYVYWLKEPIGWFAMAGVLSALVGLYISPVGWTLLASILAIISVGMVWQFLAVRMAQCQLSPALPAVHEGEGVDLVLRVRNRCPIPLWGIAVEGYLASDHSDDVPTVALSCVPGMSEADYRLTVVPQLRGHYPMQEPQVASAFPFGIWTARKKLTITQKLVVWPRVMPILDEHEFTGGRASEVGDGLRSGQAGEPIGLRGFRHGDRLRNIHWVQTARTGQMVVCERGGPQREMIEVSLDTTLSKRRWTSTTDSAMDRESLAFRVRVAASLAIHLHAHHIPLTLRIDGIVKEIPLGNQGRRWILDLLAAVPLLGGQRILTPQICDASTQGQAVAGAVDAVKRFNGGTRIQVAAGRSIREIRVAYQSSRSAMRGGEASDVQIELCWDDRMDERMGRFWREVRHAAQAA